MNNDEQVQVTLADKDARVLRMSARQEAREQLREQLDAKERQRSAFAFVDSPPGKSKRGEIPEVRRAAVEACLAHPGQWLHYHPDSKDDPIQPLGLAGGIRRGARGFEQGVWEVRTSHGQLYFRYVGETKDEG